MLHAVPLTPALLEKVPYFFLARNPFASVPPPTANAAPTSRNSHPVYRLRCEVVDDWGTFSGKLAAIAGVPLPPAPEQLRKAGCRPGTAQFLLEKWYTMVQSATALRREADVEHEMAICLRACEMLCCDLSEHGILTDTQTANRFTDAGSSAEAARNIIPDAVALLRTSPATVVPDGVLCSVLNVLELKSPGTALLGLSTEAICQVASTSRVADGDVAALEAVAEALQGYPNRAASRAAAEFSSVQQATRDRACAPGVSTHHRPSPISHGNHGAAQRRRHLLQRSTSRRPDSPATAAAETVAALLLTTPG